MKRLDQPRKPREMIRKQYKRHNQTYYDFEEWAQKKHVPTRRQELEMS